MAQLHLTPKTGTRPAVPVLKLDTMLYNLNAHSAGSSYTKRSSYASSFESYGTFQQLYNVAYDHDFDFKSNPLIPHYAQTTVAF